MLRRRGVVRTRPHRFVWVMDVLAYMASSASLFFTLDQVRLVWAEQTASGVSLPAWSFYTLSAVVWLCYGLVHRERIIIVVNSLAFVTNGLVALGVVLYG